MRLPHIALKDKTFNALSLAIIGAAIVLLIAGVLYYVQENRETQAINEQTERTNQLIDQLKVIAKENRRLNRQNRNYNYCTAVLFARYTQTQRPIVISDLEKCVVDSFSEQETQSDAEARPNNQPSSITNDTRTSSNSQTPTANTPTQPTQPDNEPTPRNSLLLDHLKEHTCSPLYGLLGTCL